MGFTGNLSSVNFPDILQLISMGTKTGTLHITQKDSYRDIYFKNGRVILASTDHDVETFENELLRTNRINRQDLAKAREIMELTGKDYPSTLVFLGIFEKDQVADLMRRHVETVLYEIFGWNEGEFEFQDGVLPNTDYIVNAINTMNILMEGTRRIDEWNKIKEALPNSNTVLSVSSSSFAQKDEVRLSPSEAQVLSLIDGDRSIEEIEEKSPFSELDTARALYSLKVSGLVHASGMKESKRVKLEDQKRLFQVTSRLYENIFGIVLDILSEKIGKASNKLLHSAYEGLREEYEVLSFIDMDENSRIEFRNFAVMAMKMPEETRVHEVSVGLSSLLGKYLDVAVSTMGSHQKKRIVSRIVTESEEHLSENINLLKKYGIFHDLSRVLNNG